MDVIRQDYVATDNPEIGACPGFDEQFCRRIVREQWTAGLCAYSQKNDDRTKTGLDCRKMCGAPSLASVTCFFGSMRRRRRAPPSINVFVHGVALRSPASSIRTRLSRYGRRMVNVSPLPSLLSMAISPPCSRTM